MGGQETRRGEGAVEHRGESEGRGMARGRTLYLPALLVLVAAVLVACAVALLTVEQKAEAAFPGKNGRIAYNDLGVIYTIKPDGSGKSKVVNTSVAGDPIDYSPDGKRIAYTSYEGDNDANPTGGPQKDAEIYTIKVDGTGKFQLTHNKRYDWGASYSPDGERIAFTHYDGHDDEIYTINADGTGAFRVTNNSTNEFFPSYSPDGKKIVFSGSHRKLSRPRTYTADIYTIGVNGKNRVRLTHNNTTDSAPDYSPNGKRIAFAGFVDSSSPKVHWNIYTIRARGGGKTKVAGGGTDPDYSPDGKKIVYYTDPQLLYPDVYTINAGGGGKSKVAVGRTPAWGSRP
jgi:Tol biopolymer transport system component